MRINEIFYSIQGEGVHTGVPMVFIRTSGCNLNCTLCDTKHDTFTEMSLQDILTVVNALNIKCKTICLTGGEPTYQGLYKLLTKLTDLGYKIHLETNGFKVAVYWSFVDWVTLSPKDIFTLKTYSYAAHEIKLVVDTDTDSPWAWEEVIQIIKEGNRYTPVYLQPADGPHLQTNIEVCVKLCKKYPIFRLGIQAQKYWNIT